MNALRKIRRVIDTINDWVGKIAKYILIIILFALIFEVVARYVFNSPTIWVQDISRQALCAMGALGGGYALLYNQHVKVDVFYGGWSERTRAIVDLATCALYLLFMVLLVVNSIDLCMESWAFKERAATVFAPPLYYVKTIIPVGAILLLLQAIAKLIHDVIVLVCGESEDMRFID